MEKNGIWSQWSAICQLSPNGLCCLCSRNHHTTFYIWATRFYSSLRLFPVYCVPSCALSEAARRCCTQVLIQLFNVDTQPVYMGEDGIRSSMLLWIGRNVMSSLIVRTQHKKPSWWLSSISLRPLKLFKFNDLLFIRLEFFYCKIIIVDSSMIMYFLKY